MAIKIEKKILVKFLNNYSKLLEAEAVKQAALEQDSQDELFDKSHEVFEFAEMIRTNKEIEFK